MNEHECQDSWFCFGCFEFVCGCEVNYAEEHKNCGGNCFFREVALAKIFRVFQQIQKFKWGYESYTNI